MQLQLTEKLHVFEFEWSIVCLFSDAILISEFTLNKFGG